MLLVSSALLVSTGCMAQARPDWVRKLTWWEKEELDPRGQLAPYKRMVALKELKEKIPSMPQAEQQAQAAQMAEEYRNESDPLIRAQIVRTIAHCGSPAAGDVLRSAMNDSDRDIRLAGCDGWIVHGGPETVGMLSNAWRNDPSLDVRLAAGRGLGKTQGTETTAALAQGLEDPNPAVQYRAVYSLRESTGKDFGDSVNAWREYVAGGAPKEISTAQRMKLDYF
jgi:hypothetical protein